MLIYQAHASMLNKPLNQKYGQTQRSDTANLSHIADSTCKLIPPMQVESNKRFSVDKSVELLV